MSDLPEPTMISWFGPEPWNSVFAVTSPHVPAPLGEPCHECPEPICEGERGLRYEAFGLQGISEGFVNIHLSCHWEKRYGPGWTNVLSRETVRDAGGPRG